MSQATSPLSFASNSLYGPCALSFHASHERNEGHLLELPSSRRSGERDAAKDEGVRTRRAGWVLPVVAQAGSMALALFCSLVSRPSSARSLKLRERGAAPAADGCGASVKSCPKECILRLLVSIGPQSSAENLMLR